MPFCYLFSLAKVSSRTFPFLLWMLPNKLFEKEGKGTETISCHKLFSSLSPFSLSLFLPFYFFFSPEHEIPFQFIEFSSIFLFGFFWALKLIFCSLRNLIYIETVYFSPFSVLSVPVLLNVADKIRFVSFYDANGEREGRWRKICFYRVFLKPKKTGRYH